ncbi:hypothetical protein [Hellea balneolensis]|uniref:hypothetical protein n=1 Tax=Hellea balneolensis TaxID=287478 RepID=UPI0004168945|nr:hypothetical protein [Hellea balneolensis]
MSDTDAPELTALGSGKSEAEVAFDLLSKLKGQGVWGERNISAILDMYAECLDAAKGLRAYEGQERINVPVLQFGGKAPAIPAQTTQRQAVPVQQPQTQAVQRHQQTLQRQQQTVDAQQQTVHSQQQKLNQAFKQG